MELVAIRQRVRSVAANAVSHQAMSPQERADKDVKRLLIYRLGSLGDTVVAIPSFRLLEKAFPLAERRVLTAHGKDEKAPRIADLIEQSGVVQGFLYYDAGGPRMTRFLKLRQQIREWRPDMLVYLAESRRPLVSLRDFLFFKSCGIRRIVGIPWRNAEFVADMRNDSSGLRQHQAQMLANRLLELGPVDLNDAGNWSLRLNRSEIAVADAMVQRLPPHETLIACSLGTKVDTNDWGLPNWLELVRGLRSTEKNAALVIVGAQSELETSERLLRAWAGPGLNLCGMVNPRECAAVLALADVFIGHDSGPIHLASSVGTRCVGIYSARNPPGEWFPFGVGHRVLYHQTHCYGCKLAHCALYDKKCIKSITVAEVLDAVVAALREPRQSC